MKKLFFSILCLSISFSALHAQGIQQVTPSQAAEINKKNPAPPPAEIDPNAGKFKFKEETHDFGEVPEGPAAECDFEFKNVGKSPIVIIEAHGSCGCTVPKWPTDPILPKKKGVIHVTYNTHGRVGVINKDVFITSNAQQKPMKLHITGTVKATPKPAEPVAAPPPPPPPDVNK